MVTKEQILAAQEEWGAGVVKIGSLKDSRSECEEFTNDFLDKLYAFDLGTVLFKPTKCAVEQFRDIQGPVPTDVLTLLNKGPGAHIRGNAYRYHRVLDRELARVRRVG